MQIPLEITFRNVEPSPALKEIAAEAKKVVTK